jgi:hypothetical protein
MLNLPVVVDAAAATVTDAATHCPAAICNNDKHELSPSTDMNSRQHHRCRSKGTRVCTYTDPAGPIWLTASCALPRHTFSAAWTRELTHPHRTMPAHPSRYRTARLAFTQLDHTRPQCKRRPPSRIMRTSAPLASGAASPSAPAAAGPTDTPSFIPAVAAATQYRGRPNPPHNDRGSALPRAPAPSPQTLRRIAPGSHLSRPTAPACATRAP